MEGHNDLQNAWTFKDSAKSRLGHSLHNVCKNRPILSILTYRGKGLIFAIANSNSSNGRETYFVTCVPDFCLIIGSEKKSDHRAKSKRSNRMRAFLNRRESNQPVCRGVFMDATQKFGPRNMPDIQSGQ